MIRTFADNRTLAIFNGRYVRSIHRDLQRQARDKLVMLNLAQSLDDLAETPGNRLERLRGDRRGQHSIRVNRQWRECFRWRGGDTYDVEIADYHD
jgi:proteic killer suppression protein